MREIVNTLVSDQEAIERTILASRQKVRKDAIAFAYNLDVESVDTVRLTGKVARSIDRNGYSPLPE